MVCATTLLKGFARSLHKSPSERDDAPGASRSLFTSLFVKRKSLKSSEAQDISVFSLVT